MWDAQSILTEAIQILSDFYAKVNSRDSASETTTDDFKVGSIFDEFTGKTVKGAWYNVEAIACDSHLRDNTTRVICEYLESSITGHFYQRICPTMVQVWARILRWRIARILFIKWL